MFFFFDATAPTVTYTCGHLLSLHDALPFFQTPATLGLFAALLVVIATRSLIGEEAFADWGWRIPFLISVILLGVSLWIRLQLQESPVFRRMKEDDRKSTRMNSSH